MEKKIDIKRYGDDTPILPLTNNVKIYKYSGAMLKHMLKNALEVLRYDLLYSKKKVKIQPNNEDRWAHRTNVGGMTILERIITLMIGSKSSAISCKL